MKVTRDLALKTPALRTKEVAVPELGEGAVIVARELRASERSIYEAELHRRSDENGRIRDTSGYREKLIAMCALDGDSDRPLFDSPERLRDWPSHIVSRLADAVVELSFPSAAEVKDATGKSSATDNSDSG